MKDQRIHATLLTLVGGYFLFIAYQLLQSQRAGTADISVAAAAVFTVLFACAGVAVLIYAFFTWRKYGGKEKNDPKDRSSRK